MKKMVAKVFLASAIGLTSACGVETSNDVDFDNDDIHYTQDEKTGLCFSYVAAGRDWWASPVALGYTNVPCTAEVLKLVK